MLLSIVAALIGALYFVEISIALRRHFRSDRFPPGVYLLMAVCLTGIGVFLVHAVQGDLHYEAVFMALTVAAYLLFKWAVSHSRNRLKLAFDADVQSDAIISTGPWKYIRHPFYSSYITFWMACAIATQHPLSLAAFLALLAVYVRTARAEERGLTAGPLGEEYSAYRARTGFLFPRLTPGT